MRLSHITTRTRRSHGPSRTISRSLTSSSLQAAIDRLLSNYNSATEIDLDGLGFVPSNMTDHTILVSTQGSSVRMTDQVNNKTNGSLCSTSHDDDHDDDEDDDDDVRL